MLLPLLQNLRMLGERPLEGGTKARRIHPRYIYEEADEPETVDAPGVPASVVKAKAEVQRVTEQVAALFNVTAMPPEYDEDDDEVILLML